VKAAEPTKESKLNETKERSSMVCDNCGSDAHVTFYKDCPKYCTVCVASGHNRRSFACPTRVCTKCRANGHNARQCTFCDTCQANHAKGKCPRKQCAYCEEYRHEAKQSPEKPRPTCYACGSGTHQCTRWWARQAWRVSRLGRMFRASQWARSLPAGPAAARRASAWSSGGPFFSLLETSTEVTPVQFAAAAAVSPVLSLQSEASYSPTALCASSRGRLHNGSGSHLPTGYAQIRHLSTRWLDKHEADKFGA
jgi:hypothetical protein